MCMYYYSVRTSFITNTAVQFDMSTGHFMGISISSKCGILPFLQTVFRFLHPLYGIHIFLFPMSYETSCTVASVHFPASPSQPKSINIT
jgi:hypothetical protein